MSDSESNTTAVFGSITIEQEAVVVEALQDRPFSTTEFIHRGAFGAENYADKYAIHNGFQVRKFHPDFDVYHEEANDKRDRKMMRKADNIVHIRDPQDGDLLRILQTLKGQGFEVIEQAKLDSQIEVKYLE